MIAEEFSRRDALGLAELVKRREIKPIELVEEAVRRIEALNPALNAVVLKLYDLARGMAESPLPDGAFQGIPFVMKDLATQWQGVPTRNTCRYFPDVAAAQDSDISSRLRQAGFILVGKSNSPENGWALSTEPALYGVTRNPWNDQVVPGGSSGGSAVAVASGMVPLADASDGAGSIRVPAANNGLIGLKPSRGRVTLGPDQVDYWYGGAVFLCVSRSVRDTAAYLDAVCGAWPGEPYALAKPDRPYLSLAAMPPARLRVGFTTTSPGGGPVHPEVKAAVEATARLCEGLGHAVEEKPLALDFAAAFTNYVRVTAVQTAAGFDAVAAAVGRPATPADVEPTTWAIIARGRSISGPDHAIHVETMRRHGKAIVGQLAPYDVYLTPTLPQPSRPLGWYDMSETDIDRYNATKMMPDCAFTAPFNISGQPAMSVPMHWTPDGLPVGVQLVGRIGDEATLIQLAAQLEQAAPWGHRRPPVSL